MPAEKLPTGRNAAAASAWPHRLALVTAGATLVLILAGGVVTTTGSGLAVPDWPTTFGYNMFAYPWSKMVGGVFYEHSHRLIGSLVGLLSLALALSVWGTEPRRWVGWLAGGALALVILQGILGGLRVILLQGTLAIVHGVLAYGFFALVASLAVVTSRTWREDRGAIQPGALIPVRRLALGTTAAILLQILFGAVLTHRDVRLDAHLFLAAVISCLVPVLALRLLRGGGDWPELVRPAKALRDLWILQLLLGLGAYAAKYQALGISMGPVLLLAFPVSHRLAGGLLLVSSLVVTLLAYRRRGSSEPAERRQPLPGRVPA